MTRADDSFDARVRIARQNLEAAETGGRSYGPFAVPRDTLAAREAREIELLRLRLLAVRPEGG